MCCVSDFSTVFCLQLEWTEARLYRKNYKVRGLARTRRFVGGGFSVFERSEVDRYELSDGRIVGENFVVRRPIRKY